MFIIEVQGEFYAAHQLRLPDGSTEPLHSHHWKVSVCVKSSELDALETVMDFHQLEQILKRICNAWDNRNLNDIAPFDKAINPSAERVAQRIAELLIPEVPAPAKLQSVSITEAPNCVAIYHPE